MAPPARLVFALALLMGTGCSESSVDGAGGVLPTEGTARIALSPDSLDLGESAVGAEVRRVVSVENTGEVVVGVETPAIPGLRFELTPTVLSPGELGRLEVVWLPDQPGQFFEQATLEAHASREQSARADLKLLGSALGPRLSLSTFEHDFGELSVGCKDTLKVTVANAGNEPLRVDGLRLRGGEAFELLVDEPLPWTLPPFGSEELRIQYSASHTLGDAASVEIDSSAGPSRVMLRGRGLVDFEDRIEAHVSAKRASTILVHASPAIIRGNVLERGADQWEDSLATFFEALQDSGVHYRVGFIWSETGESYTHDYIDHSVPPRVAARMAEDMVKDGASGWQNNDYAFDTFVMAMDQNADWLVEDDKWRQSKLSLISINNDDDRSKVPASTALDEIRDYKGDADDIVFHGIIVPASGGTCGTPIGSQYDWAMAETGGIQLDFCAPDWHDHMRKLVVNSVVGGVSNGAVVLPLKGTPVVSSIRVTQDGRSLPAGWSYDPSRNAVLFDRTYALDDGVVAVTYQGSRACGS